MICDLGIEPKIVDKALIKLDLGKEKKSENEEIKNKGSDTKTTSNINSHLETITMMLIGTILFVFLFNSFYFFLDANDLKIEQIQELNLPNN